MAEADRMAHGESPEAAAVSARREFGNAALIREITREMWGGRALERLLQDLRFGIRMLARRPGFSVLAILCLTLGIGANAAVYAWIEGILLRPYPAVSHPESLVVLAGTSRGAPGFDTLSWPDWDDLRRRCTLFDAFIAEKITGTTLSVGDRAERVPGSLVSANYFEALGVRPTLGRGFLPAEESGRNAHPVVVISHRLWSDRFHRDPGILGKTQVLNGIPHTIVGVAPEGFLGTFVGYAFQFWVPASMQEAFDSNVYKLEDRGERWIEGFARVKPGVSRAQAQEEVSAVAKRLEADYPATNRGRGIRLLPLWQSPFNGASVLLPTLRIALGVVIFVLFVACANVGNLLLAQSVGRRHEMTVRLAIGAGRGRLVVQLLTEGLILSSFAVAGGLLLAYGLRNALVWVIPPRSAPLTLAGRVDWRVLALSAGVCVLVTLLVGLAPAMQSGSVDLAGALKSGSGGVLRGTGRSRLQSGLVVLQVTLSFLLLVGAGLLVRSMQRIRSASPGFSADGVLTTGIDLASAGYDPPRAKSFQDALLERVRGLPGVEAAAYSRVRPFGLRDYSSAPLTVDRYRPAPDEEPSVAFNEVSPEYFAALGIPLVSGREFARTDDETSRPVAVVNETMAGRYWRGEDAVGRVFRSKGRTLEVVGVVRDSKTRTLLDTAEPFFYVPLRQSFSVPVVLYVRTARSPESLAKGLAGEVHALDEGLAPSELISMREQVERSTATQRVALVLLIVVGGLGLVLAAVGIYGMMAHAVSQSTRELGLRMALGADVGDLLRLVLSRGLRLAAAGVAIGAAASLGSTRLLGYLLYGVSPRDPMAFGSAAIVMALAALAACVLPARRAMRTDPVRALRAEP
jgi:predicted permease